MLLLFKTKSVLLACQLVASLVGKHHAFALSEIGNARLESYIIMMKEDPILTHDINITASNRGRNLKKSVNSNSNKKYKKKLKKKHDEVSKNAGISKEDMGQKYYYCSNGFQAFMTSEQAAKMRKDINVAQVVKDKKRVITYDSMPKGKGSRRLGESSSPSIRSNEGKPPKRRDLAMSHSPADLLGLTDPGGPWAKGYDGEGVVVGVIDTGIWPEHISFADDGTYSSLPDFVPNSDSLPCEFGNTTHSIMDTAYNCTNKLLGARFVLDTWIKANGILSDQFYSARDHDGHGTHTASTAAGNRDVNATINEAYLGNISGIAPRARIIAYKSLVVQSKLTGLDSNDLKLIGSGLDSDSMKAIDYACQDGVDVINYSVGGLGDLASLTSIAFLNANRAGIFVASTAGNDGPSPSTINKVAPWNTIVAASTVPITKDAPTMADFSSRGPNLQAPDIIKPDITAPGVKILAGYSPQAHITTDSGETVDPGLFALLSGTSMASPHIAGMFALMKQANPEWSPAMAKSAIMTTSYQNVTKQDDNLSSFIGSLVPADPFDMGAGHVNGGKVNEGSIFDPGLVYDAGYYDYLGFLCDAAPRDFFLYFPNITCEELESQGVITEARNLNYPSIGIATVTGFKYVDRTVTSVAKGKGYREYEAVVVNPEGHEVFVDPSTIRLKEGDTVSFQVAVRNIGTPPDVWGFGSLTWVEKSRSKANKSGKYEVYSPIAVKPVLFDYPSKVFRSDEVEGSISLDVSFGYSGSYRATSYGLLPATLTEVVDSGDDNHFEIPRGTAIFRVALEGQVQHFEISKGIYNLTIGEGTGPGVFDFNLPEEGPWRVRVKGDGDLRIYTWIYSLEQLLSPEKRDLDVNWNPTSAVIGIPGTIKIDWDNLAEDKWYFGVIYHKENDESQLGNTAVDIDNRGAQQSISAANQVSEEVEPTHDQPTSRSNIFN